LAGKLIKITKSDHLRCKPSGMCSANERGRIEGVCNCIKSTHVSCDRGFGIRRFDEAELILECSDLTYDDVRMFWYLGDEFRELVKLTELVLDSWSCC